MKAQNFIITLALILFAGINQLNARIVSGKVTDASDGNPLPSVNIVVKGTTTGTLTDIDGLFQIEVMSDNDVLVFSFIGYANQEVKVSKQSKIDIQLMPDIQELEECFVVGYAMQKRCAVTGSVATAMSSPMPCVMYDAVDEDFNTEGYSTISENGFKQVLKNPLSTFSIDVDAASYSNMRRFINSGSLPPVDAVRIEEMINYFSYDYAQPKGDVPFSINSELSTCPWNTDNYLLHVGLQGKKIEMENLPASNIVFLIDVSGSMSDYNKLPLLKSSFKMLVEQLRPQDRVAIVVYAGNSGLVLPSTPGNQKQAMIESLERLQAGGSTAGGAGLKLAYKVAADNFIKDGNNRIILATDGDFNVGQSSNGDMEKLIEAEREKGIGISVLGFGMGNYKDDKMEIIADKGNGNYAYIDNIQEAKKVLVNEFGGTLFTIAKDVKFQLEFNPAQVAEYRLIGYENRLLNEEDFDDDKKDAGEMGAGHTVTALYEIVPVNSKKSSTHLKYQQPQLTDEAVKSNDLITLKLRYKAPQGNTSQLIEQVVKNEPIAMGNTSNNFRWSAAVAEFGMLLRNSEFIGTATWESANQLAQSSKGDDMDGYRGEMIRLIKSAELLKSGSAER